MERPCCQPLGYHIILVAALILCALIASCALFFVPTQSSAVRADLGFFFLPGTQSLSPATRLAPRRRQQRGTPGRRRSVDNADPCPAESEGIAGEETPCHRLPQALIIGVKKGGTRALLEFIRLHPDVRAVGPETHFFDRNYDRGLGWYRSRMPPTTSTQLTMEKTPSYFVTKFAPGRIHRMSRDIKLLVVLRDPVTRAISDYAQTASKRPEVKSFEQLVFANATTGLVDTSWSAIRIGTYCQHLERWLRYFPLNRIHFVPAEGLVHEPAAEMARVEQFLGLKPYINQSHFFFNETKGFPCVWRPQHRGGGGPHCLGKTKGRHHPSVSEETLQILRDFYKPFNAKLYELTGINFGWQR